MPSSMLWLLFYVVAVLSLFHLHQSFAGCEDTFTEKLSKPMEYLILKNCSVPCCISVVSPTRFEKEERERENISDTDRGELYLHRRSLSDAKLAALCSEVWPVLALIGGVDTGLRAGGLCQHTPSGRRAVLLGVLKEGSSMAKLQWEETDLSVRYYSFVFVHDKILSVC